MPPDHSDFIECSDVSAATVSNIAQPNAGNSTTPAEISIVPLAV